jgi:PTH1 family peptidyl-tRNA hydrolase
MWLVVGLGNPGPRYSDNRHNVGFRVVEELARRWPFAGFRDKFGGDVASGTIGRDKAVLLKPMEFMNHSGFAVTRTAQFYGVEPERMVVVHDEIDLPFGRLRLKTGGGHGGHNGLRSIFEQLGTPEFSRVRIGVGKPPGPRAADNGASWVLSNFPASEQAVLPDLYARSANSVEAILARGIRVAMNEFNAEPKPDEQIS